MDKWYINGRIHQGQEIHEVMGVKDGIIHYLGMEYPDLDMADTVDMDHRDVYPGFIDAHLHLVRYSWKKFHEVDLNQVRSFEELVATVRLFIEDNDLEPGTWVVGSGWNHEKFTVKELPDRYLLDNISTEHPILLNRACYHLCAVNSLALELAGISEEGVHVNGGQIDTDNTGRPTGILREHAESIVGQHIPPLTDKELMKSLILMGCEDLAKVGITTVHSDDFDFVGDMDALMAAYMELAKENQLPIKVVVQLRASEVAHVDYYSNQGLRSWTNYNNLRIGPIKIIADGSLGSRTAALIDPYIDDPDNRGILVFEPDFLESMVKRSLECDFDLAIHAIGDRTMSIILDFYEKYLDMIRARDFRPSIIHCQIASAALLKRMEAMQIIANIQPIFTITDWLMAEDRVGPERVTYSYCWKKYLDMGIPCASSSDAPIETFDPILGIYAATTRCDLEGRPVGGWLPEERLSIDQAIHLYTQGGAYASKEEHLKGALKVGMTADFAVLSDNLLQIDPHRITKAKVLATYVNGIRCPDI